MTESGGAITFRCDNTNYPKSDSDRSGSGIGIENTRRRLELLYAGKYEWEQSLENDIYHVCVKIIE
jgi:sensor histidine kinase YesM